MMLDVATAFTPSGGFRGRLQLDPLDLSRPKKRQCLKQQWNEGSEIAQAI